MIDCWNENITIQMTKYMLKIIYFYSCINVIFVIELTKYYWVDKMNLTICSKFLVNIILIIDIYLYHDNKKIV